MTRNVIYNFGKNVSFQPKYLAAPKSERELLHLLKQHRGESVRVMASRHAWSDAIVTDGLLISVEHFSDVRINHDRQSVTVGAGCQIKHLVEQLKSNGLTLPSLGLIDEQTVAGATATSTHGSGKHSLSHYVRRVRVAHYDPQTDEPNDQVPILIHFNANRQETWKLVRLEHPVDLLPAQQAIL